MRGRRRQHIAEDTAQLLTRTREGENDAPQELFVRYERFARTVARRARATDVDDAVAEAFRKTLSAIMNGHGPVSAFGPYLATAIRSVVADQRRHASTVTLVGDDFDGFDQPAGDLGDNDPHIAAAFSSLPERWRTVLWYTDVEGFPPREVAAMLDLSTSNAASALRVRARLALRAAYLVQLADEGHTPEVRAYLNALIDGSPTDSALRDAVAWHLDDCIECNELAGVVGRLTGDKVAPLFVPALLASFATQGSLAPAGTVATAAAPTASGSTAATTTGISALPGVAIVGAVVAAVAIAGVAVATVLSPADLSELTTQVPEVSVDQPLGALDGDVFIGEGRSTTSELTGTTTTTSIAPSTTSVPSTSSAPASTIASVATTIRATAQQSVASTSPPRTTTTTTTTAVVVVTTTPSTAAPTTTLAPATTVAPTTVAPVGPVVPTPQADMAWVFANDFSIVEIHLTGLPSGSIEFSSPIVVLRAIGTACDQPTVCSFDGLSFGDDLVVVAQSTASTLTVSVIDAEGNVVERQSA